MGYRPVRTIEDANRHGLALQVTCRGCGRKAVFSASSFLLYNRIGLGTRLDVLGGKMVCTGFGGDRGCGARSVEILPIDWPPINSAPPPPKPIG